MNMAVAMNKEAHRKMIRSEVKDYILITFGLVIYAFGWTVFMLPYEFVTGGVTGISAIIYYSTGFPLQSSYLLINIVLLAIALKILGFHFMVKTIYAIFMLSGLLWAAQALVTGPDGELIKILGEGQQFMSLVIGMIMTGSALAIVFLNNGSTGGTDIVAACVNKYYNFSLGQVLLMVDVLIILSCIVVFGDWQKVVFGFVAMAIENFVLDYVINASRESVQFLIFSKKYQEIADAIGTETKHGITLLDGHGWYSGAATKVLCIVARKRESVDIFRLIKLIDPDAFVSQSAVVGVYGEGFDKIKVRTTKRHRNNRRRPQQQNRQRRGTTANATAAATQQHKTQPGTPVNGGRHSQVPASSADKTDGAKEHLLASQQPTGNDKRTDIRPTNNADSIRDQQHS